MKIVTIVKRGTVIGTYASTPAQVVIVDIDNLSQGSFEDIFEHVNAENAETRT